MKHSPLHLLLISSIIILIWSLIHPTDYGVWFFEISTGVIGIIILILTYKRFPFSGIVYLLIGIHFAILAIGAKYTYSQMPLFNWLSDTFGIGRNHYDRVGHFFQGFVPALITREILLRTTKLEQGKMLNFLCISVPLSISAFWEVLEWWIAATFYPGAGQEWLGTQGDIWDTQKDMFLALFGAILSINLLYRVHDKSISLIHQIK